MSTLISTAGLLGRTALFAGLSPAELASLASRTRTLSFPSGQPLFFEGDPCRGLHIIAAGRVRIFKMSSAGREHVLAVEGPGASVAEVPVFDGGAYPASASAADDAEILFISREDLHALCRERPDISLKLLEVVGARLRRLIAIIEELSFTTVRHRLIAWILRRADEANSPAFSLGINHQELASQIGTVRELVSRNLARLQAQGFISHRNGELTLVDRPALEEELSATQ